MKSKKNVYLLGLVGFVFILSGCSIKHHISKDYDVYLIKNEGKSNLPKTSFKSDYSLKDSTKMHRYEFRAIIVGYANLWIVEFGEILDLTLKSRDIQKSFGRLEPESLSKKVDDNLIIFELKKYEFTDYRAQVVLDISVMQKRVGIFTKTYTSEGKEQVVKMLVGGVFTMRNAIQESTKFVIDDILGQFIFDINVYLKE